MAFGDLMFRQKNLIKVKAMNVSRTLTEYLHAVTPFMHAKRRIALEKCLMSVANGSTITVTAIGRGIDCHTTEKHAIKRADRLCSNHHLHSEIVPIYSHLTQQLIANNSRPIIHIDWSDLDPYKKHFLLRASLAFEGRSLTLYEEVHSVKTKEKPATHAQFLHRLKRLLPKICCPILVTDAGFRSPWYRLVLSLGWDFVGRERNRTYCRLTKDEPWQSCKALYSIASSTPKVFNGAQIVQNNPFDVTMVLYKSKKKGRVANNREGKRYRNKANLVSAKRGREPWLLMTSLKVSKLNAKRITDIYGTRMQIEEAFRDNKSSRFGCGLEQHYCNSLQRMRVLILLASLAHIFLTFLGLAAEMAGLTKNFKANTERRYRTLSYFFIGRRIMTKTKLTLLKQCWDDALGFFEQTSIDYGSGL